MFDKWKETETSKRPDIVITILTLSSFVAGAIAPFSIPLSVMLYLPIAMYPFFRKINHLTPVHIGYCTMSTYIFGFLDIYSLLYPSIFSLYVWLLTIRYYAEFQLNNCYHHDLLNWSGICSSNIGFTIYHSKEYCIANTFLLL